MGLGLIFVFVGFVSFIVIVIMLRPTPDQKALDKRMMAIGSKRSKGGVNSDVEQYLKTRNTGSFGWIEDIIEDISVARTLRLLILQSNSKTTLGTLVFKCLATGAGVAVITLLVVKMLWVAALAGLATSFLPIMMMRMKRTRRVNSFNTALAESIDMMARSMRAGHSLPAAIGIVAEQAMEPVRAEFAELSRQQNYGLPLRDAMNQLLERVPSQDLRVVATGMLVQKDTGGNLAEVLDRIGAVIRDRVRIQGEIRTHTAQGRLTGWILCALPVVMLALINMVNPGYSAPMFKDPTGQKLLGAGVVLLIIGGLIIRQIIRGIEI